LTLGENVTVSLPDALVFSVSDSILVDESLTMFLGAAFGSPFEYTVYITRTRENEVYITQSDEEDVYITQKLEDARYI